MSHAPKVLHAPDEFDALIAHARSGSGAPLDELLERFRPQLTKKAEQLLDHHLRAKMDDLDLVQQTFLEALKKVRDFRGQSAGECAAWLKRIRNHEATKANKQFTTDKRDARREVSLSEQVTEQLQTRAWHDQPDPAELLWRIISLLRPRELLVLLLHDLELMSFNEIGPILRRSDDAVRKLHQRALVHCRHEARLLVDQEGFEQILGLCESIVEDKL